MMSWFSRGEKVLKQADLLVKQQALDLANLLRIQACTSTQPGVESNSQRRLVVTLTTFDKRIDDVYLCIESLLHQSLRPNRLMLWLSEEEFPRSRPLPAMLLRQQARGLEIHYCPRDIGPYKKLIPALSLCPNDLLVTVDDDVMYPVDTLDLLYRAHLHYPKAVVANHAHQLIRDRHGRVMPYRKWPKGVQVSTPTSDVFPVGIGGVLYPPGALHPDVMKENIFMSQSPGADDIWFKAMAVKAGTLAFVAPNHRPWLKRYLFIESSQIFALKRLNKCSVTGNDAKLAAVFSTLGCHDGRC